MLVPSLRSPIPVLACRQRVTLEPFQKYSGPSIIIALQHGGFARTFACMKRNRRAPNSRSLTGTKGCRCDGGTRDVHTIGRRVLKVIETKDGCVHMAILPPHHLGFHEAGDDIPKTSQKILNYLGLRYFRHLTW